MVSAHMFWATILLGGMFGQPLLLPPLRSRLDLVGAALGRSAPFARSCPCSAEPPAWAAILRARVPHYLERDGEECFLEVHDDLVR